MPSLLGDPFEPRAMENEASFRSAAGTTWQTEPFRIFFPLGVLLSWVGVGHWLLYAVGITQSYSCETHGFIQMQGFLLAFAVGFLLTALPRRTRSAPPSNLQMALIASGLVVATVGSVAERWVLAQLGYLLVFAVLVRFAASRFLGAGAGRRPPAAFVLIPIAILHGVLGALLIAFAASGVHWASGLGNLMVQQGVFLCLVVGVGSLILPLMSGMPPPADLGSSPAENRKALVYASVGAVILASFVAEHLGWGRAAAAVRSVAVVAGFAAGGHVLRRPGKPGLHRWLVWLSVWMIPLGLLASALWPDLRVAVLHVAFISGFGLMAFGVATHVSLSHLGMEDLALGRPWPVVVIGSALLWATLTRVAADAADTYFEHLGLAAAMWLIGTAAWLVFFAPAFAGKR